MHGENSLLLHGRRYSLGISPLRAMRSSCEPDLGAAPVEMTGATRILLQMPVDGAQPIVLEGDFRLQRNVLEKLVSGMFIIFVVRIGEPEIEVGEGQMGIHLYGRF